MVNPSAGRGHEVLDRARAALQAAGVPHSIHESTGPDDVARLVAEGAAAGHEDFAAVGGDGMAHLVLNGLMDLSWASSPTLAILPAGSGSDFIRTFALPHRLEEVAVRLATPDRYPTDVGRMVGAFGTRYFLNAANVGVSAASAEVAARLPRWLGGARYRLGFWIALPRFGREEVTVRVDHHKHRGRMLTVVVANGQFFGGGLNIAPRATVQDGRFDVQCFAGPRRMAFSVMPRVARGSHLTHRSVRRYVGSRVTIEAPEGWPIEADGELIGSGAVELSVVPGAVLFKI